MAHAGQFGPQVDRLGNAQQAVGDLRPYDPSFETPDEGGINGPPARGSIRVRVKPSRVQLAVSKPARPPRSAAQAAALRSAPDLPRRAAGPCQLTCSATLNASVTSPRDRLELVKPQMRP